MIVIPSIDLSNGKCVRLSQGCRSQAKTYATSPLELAEQFESAGASLLHLVNLDAASRSEGLTSREVAIRIIRTLKIPVQYGGGITFDITYGRNAFNRCKS